MSTPRHGDTGEHYRPTWTWTPLFTSPLPSSSFDFLETVKTVFVGHSSIMF